MTIRTPLALSIAFATALLGSAAPALADRGDSALLDRHARGDITAFGGARRVTGDLTGALNVAQ